MIISSIILSIKLDLLLKQLIILNSFIILISGILFIKIKYFPTIKCLFLMDIKLMFDSGGFLVGIQELGTGGHEVGVG